MKIAFLNDGPYEYAIGGSTAIGGLERNIWILSRVLAAAGWSVKVGVHGLLGGKKRKFIEGVEYIRIGHGPIRQGQILFEWGHFLHDERPDWVFWAGATHLWGPLVEIAKFLNVRTVFQSALDADVQPHRKVMSRARWWWLYAWGLRRADRIFVQHADQLLMLPPRLRLKACTLPKVGLLPLDVLPHSQREDYVAWVGMLRHHKRPDVLIDIARRTPDVRFIICGGPTSYQTSAGYSMRMIEMFTELPNVEYRGRVSPDEAMDVIANAALLLCTSDEEGFPNTFMQAWANGTPIVTVKVDPDCIIKKYRLGTVSGTVDVAAEDIRSLIASRSRRDEIAIRARQYIENQHGPEKVMQIFTTALQGDCLSAELVNDRLSTIEGKRSE